MLTLETLTRTHAGARAPAVDGVSLTVAGGEVLVLVGPSGCGKSSVLRMIAGLDEPSSGRVILDGVDATFTPPEKRDIAMVFQGYALYPHLTVRGNMEFPLKMRGVAVGERRARVEKAADRLRIGGLLDRSIDQLSGGERQRVAMGRAIVREPKVFLFDEPLSNLDAALRTTLRAELATLLRSMNATAVYVTHDQSEAMTIGHRVAVMRAGKVEQIGTAREIYEAPATEFVGKFLGTPPLNVVPLGDDKDRASKRARLGSRSIAFRPERAQCASPSGAATAGVITFDGKVSLVEPLGAETVIHVELTLGGHVVRVRETGFSKLERGAAVRVDVAPEECMYFDADERRC